MKEADYPVTKAELKLKILRVNFFVTAMQFLTHLF